MNVLSPSYKMLKDILKPGAEHVVIAAPFMTKAGLQVVEKALNAHRWGGIKQLEIWVSLSKEAHCAGVMDFVALLNFIEVACALQPQSIEIELFEALYLHAKVFRSRHGALVTSANLSDRAFNTNVEIGILTRPGKELQTVDAWLNETRRTKMKTLTYNRFRKFVHNLPEVTPTAAVLEGEAEIMRRRHIPPHIGFPLR